MQQDDKKTPGLSIAEMGRLLSVADVAELFGVSQTTVYRIATSRKLPYYKISGMLRFSEEEILKYLKEAKVLTLEEYHEQIGTRRPKRRLPPMSGAERIQAMNWRNKLTD